VNVLDENIIESQRQLLRNWRIPVRQIGFELGRKGMADEEIIPFLLTLRRPTLFTRDLGLYDRQHCHARYSVVPKSAHKNRAVDRNGFLSGQNADRPRSAELKRSKSGLIGPN
jgi:hypothetical protein